MPLWSNRAELEAALILHRTPDIGSVRLRALLAHAGSYVDALRAGERAWRACGVPAGAWAHMRARESDALARDLAWCADENHHVLEINQADYPPPLARIGDPPQLLFVDGDPMALWQPQIAIVGSRQASHGGLDAAGDFAETLARSGFTITSGLALGIDGAAHAAALDAGACSIAVLGTGVDVIYPRRHRALAARVRAQGAIVSELPLGTESQRENFPRRNRIISGLSLGVLVVEAGLQSGSLITAREAATQGREVFAIPGSIHHPMARGCHQLIREGAQLVETAQEIIEALGNQAAQLGTDIRARLAHSASFASDTNPDGPVGNQAHAPVSIDQHHRALGSTPARSTTPEQRQLLDALGPDPVTVDRLCARSGLTAPAILSMLTLLELDGMVEALNGGRYRRLNSPI